MTGPLVTRTSWRPLPRAGCVGVEVKGVVGQSGLAIAMLRFGQHATIDEHDAPFEIDVLCIAGSGWTSIGGRTVRLELDDRVQWPANVLHRLWTDSRAMTTLIIERRVAAK